MEIFVEEIKRSIKDAEVLLEGMEGSCSRICTVISNEFSDLSLLNRHRKVKKILEKHFASNLHALSIKTYTRQEWENVRTN